ncbi:MAG: hypothetical protein AAF560_19045 [Acidobacteriota bacterium]
MKHKDSTRFARLALGTFASSLVVGAIATATLLPAENPLGGEAHASWISTSQTIAEQVMEADAVVRVQVLGQAAPRLLWHPTPEGAKSGTFAFTDSAVEVLEVYNGRLEVGDRAEVMQTGGDLLTLEGGVSRMELAEDPLYAVGSELVLFLVDISDDPVHGRKGSLFRTTNPAGRYDVFGGLVSQKAFGDLTRKAETDLGALEAEIELAIRSRDQLEAF